MNLVLNFYCLISSLLVGADLSSSVHHLFLKRTVTDLKPWKVQNNGIHSFEVVLTGHDKLHEAASGTLRDHSGAFMGETYILRNKSSGRVVSVTLFPSGQGYVMSQGGRRNVEDMRTRELVQFSRLESGKHKKFDDGCGALKAHKARAHATRLEPALRIEVPEGEMDLYGNYVVDVLFIFSTAAKTIVEEALGMSLDEYTAIQKLMVETAWANSGITQLRLRIIGREIWPQDIAVTEENALWVRNNTLTTLTNSGADLVAYFTNGTEAGTSDATGYAGIEDYYTLQFVDNLKAWRHELGHNAGMAHCPVADDGFAYKHGWDMAATGGTIMCGNTVSLYSNPGIVYDSAKAGDADQADASRQWNYYKRVMSGIRKSKFPAEERDADYLLFGTMTYRETGDNILEWTVSEGVDKMIFEAYSAELAEQYNQFSLFVTSPCCEGIYHGDHTISTAHILIFDCPGEGTWRAYITGEGPTNFTISFFDVPGESRRRKSRPAIVGPIKHYISHASEEETALGGEYTQGFAGGAATYDSTMSEAAVQPTVGHFATVNRTDHEVVLDDEDFDDADEEGTEHFTSSLPLRTKRTSIGKTSAAPRSTSIELVF